MKFYHFVPTDHAAHDGVPNPKLAKDVIPQWYKHAEIAYEDSNGVRHNGLKTCVPFLDGMISGYMLLTWTDIHVKILEDGSVDIKWDSESTSNPLAERPKETGHTMPRPAGHLPNHMVWTPKWGVKSPRGWSTLFTHPFNRFDLPFTTMSALVDSDRYYGSGNIPFFIKEGFEGTIPKGTPYVQLIPVKRAKWTASVYDPALYPHIARTGNLVRGRERGYYRDVFWVKKVYKLLTKGAKNAR